MYYHRIPRNGSWKTCKLSADEVAKIQSLTMVQRIKALAKLKEIKAKMNASLSEAETLAVLHGCAPTYDELAVDYINDQLDAKEKEAEKSAAKPA